MGWSAAPGCCGCEGSEGRFHALVETEGAEFDEMMAFLSSELALLLVWEELHLIHQSGQQGNWSLVHLINLRLMNGTGLWLMCYRGSREGGGSAAKVVTHCF